MHVTASSLDFQQAQQVSLSNARCLSNAFSVRAAASRCARAAAAAAAAAFASFLACMDCDVCLILTAYHVLWDLSSEMRWCIMSGMTGRERVRWSMIRASGLRERTTIDRPIIQFKLLFKLTYIEVEFTLTFIIWCPYICLVCARGPLFDWRSRTCPPHFIFILFFILFYFILFFFEKVFYKNKIK